MATMLYLGIFLLFISDSLEASFFRKFHRVHGVVSPSAISYSRTYIRTIENLQIELISCKPKGLFKRKKNPLIFIHGSGGGAWVFKEHWLPYFAELGYESYAVGLRGSNGTGLPPNDLSTQITISQHISDLKAVLNFFRKRGSPTPILFGHSFGGLVLSALLQDESSHPFISGASWMCSLPPSGQGRMATRFLFTRLLGTINIIRGFAFGLADKRPAMNRLLFYDDSVPDEDVTKYMNRLRLDAQIGINITDVERNLPSINANKDGSAPWTSRVLAGARVAGIPFKRLVFGSYDDYIVDPPAIRETARYAGTTAILVRGPGHNVMLGGRWKVSAQLIQDWLNTEFD